MIKTDYAVVTEKALKNGKIGFAYRDRSGGAKDSGWRMMFDKNEDRLDLVNPDKLYTCDFKRLLKYFPEIESFYKAKTYTVVEEVDGELKVAPPDKDLAAVPNKMSGKNKYVTFTGGQTHGGSIVTADPAEEKSFGKRGWEDLIPPRG